MNIRLSGVVTAIVLATGLLLLPAVTYAQENKYKFQLTPFAGYRFGGTFEDRDTGQEYELNSSPSYGVILNFPSKAPTEWEIYYSRQTTELDVAGFVQGDNAIDMQVDYLQVGGTYLFGGSKSAVPYFVATAGLTRMDPDAPETKSDTFFSFGVGGGWKYFPASRVGLRLDGRLLGTFVDSNSSIFCQAGQNGANCVINTSGKILYQFELQAGIIFRF
jgi:opacity protein-like surface antigen